MIPISVQLTVILRAAFRDFSQPLLANFGTVSLYMGAHGGAVVEVLRYKPEGRGIDSR
jgi:hypothetical protein